MYAKIFLDFYQNIKYAFIMKELKQLIDKCGGKKETAEKLMISVRYVEMILAGKKPSKRLEKMIKIYLWT